jgi:hypothetical protein
LLKKYRYFHKNGFTLYCPEDLNIEFFGALGVLKAKYMSYSIERCTEDNKLLKDQPCATP